MLATYASLTRARHALRSAAGGSMTETSITVPDRFRGPPHSGNGGYVCGVLAGLLTGGRFDLADGRAAEVTLRAPVPLDTALAVRRTGETLVAHHGEALIAEAALVPLQMQIPEPPSYGAALAVRDRSPSLKVGMHPWLNEERKGFHPICFCCGAELAPDQGLHVYAAEVEGRDQVAAAWTCHPTFAGADGYLPPEIVCAALDCPGQFAWLAAGTRTGLLGRLTARVLRSVRAGEPCVVSGWTMGSEGRKHFAGTALFDAEGTLCAYAKAVWIGRF
jgi:hypothetical protein